MSEKAYFFDTYAFFEIIRGSPAYEKYKNAYRLDKTLLEQSKKNLAIMHPLPRVGEINPELDETPNAIYFKQAGNGIPIRQALLALILGKIK